MSLVTNMVIFTAWDESIAMARLNLWCRESDPREQQFLPLDVNAAGGNKVFIAEAWAMAGNYFPHEKLAEALPTFGWQYPWGVVLVVYDLPSGTTWVHRACPEVPAGLA